MNNDYGKIAYLNVTELEKRVDKLEHPTKTVSTTRVDYAEEEFMSFEHEAVKIFDFNAYGESQVRITCNVSSDLSCDVEYIFNGEEVELSQGVTADETALTLNAKRGINTLKVVATASSDFNFKVSGYAIGFISPRPSNIKLEHLGTTFVGFLRGGIYTVYQIINDELTETFSVSGVIECSGIRNVYGDILLAVRDINNNCFTLKLSASDMSVTERLNLPNVYKKLAVFNYALTDKVYAIKGNTLVKVEKVGGLWTESVTALKISDVRFFATYNNRFLIYTDKFGYKSVVTYDAGSGEFINRKNIGNAKNAVMIYALNKKIWYYDKGYVVERTMLPETTVVKRVEGEEAVMLTNGNVIYRKENKLYFKESI